MWPFKKKEEKNDNNIYKILEQKKEEYDKQSEKETKFITCKHGFLFNDELKKLAFSYFSNGKDILIEKNFKDLIGCEYSKNNQVVGSASVTGAVIGGLLAGTTGAIIGAASGDKTYLSLELKMFFNDFDVPVVIIKNEFNHKSAYNFEKNNGFPITKQFEELYAMCQFIINQNKMNTN